MLPSTNISSCLHNCIYLQCQRSDLHESPQSGTQGLEIVVLHQIVSFLIWILGFASAEHRNTPTSFVMFNLVSFSYEIALIYSSIIWPLLPLTQVDSLQPSPPYSLLLCLQVSMPGTNRHVCIFGSSRGLCWGLLATGRTGEGEGNSVKAISDLYNLWMPHIKVVMCRWTYRCCNLKVGETNWLLGLQDGIIDEWFETWYKPISHLNTRFHYMGSLLHQEHQHILSGPIPIIPFQIIPLAFSFHRYLSSSSYVWEDGQYLAQVEAQYLKNWPPVQFHCPSQFYDHRINLQTDWSRIWCWVWGWFPFHIS